MATAAKAQAERSITTATQRIKLSVTAQLPTGASKSWSLLKPVTVIGSRRHAQIIVREEHVNRSHAAIVNTGVHVLLVDLFSDAGTYCNGRLVTRELLKDGDVVRVGCTDLQVSIELPPNPVVPRRGILAFDDPLKMPKAMRVVQVDTDEGWEIVDSTAIIGNCKQAAVGVYAEGIARAHSLIFATINGIGIMDLGSSTPLKINGNEKQMAYLRRQDRLLIGKTGLMVEFPKADGSVQAGRRKGLPEETTGDESQGGSAPSDVAAQPHGQMEDGSLVRRGNEARAVGGSAAAVMDSSEAPFTEQPELESLGSKISALQEELAESWGEINEWKKKLTLEHNNLTVGKQELQNKEKELRLLAAEVEHRTSKVADQEQQCEQQHSEFSAREAAIDMLKAGLDSRDLKIREQQAKLATVTDELETRQSEIVRRKAELDKIRAEVEHRSSKVADQELRCEQQQSEIDGRNAEIEKIKADLDGRDLEIREQQAKLTTVAGELETRQKEVERFAAEYETVREEIESRRLELEPLENSIAEERSRLEKEQQSMSELSEGLCDRETKLSSREETLLQQRADLESNLRELESRYEEIGSRESQLTDYEKALQKRHGELVEREQQIHRRSEIVTRFKQFIEEANEAYDITVNSAVDPAPETIPVLPESDETPAKQSRADATAVLNRARREMRAAVADLKEETRQLAEELPGTEAGNQEPSSGQPAAGVDLQSLEPEVRDRFRALKRIGSNGKSDADLVEQIRAELLKEGKGGANRRGKKKAWWKG